MFCGIQRRRYRNMRLAIFNTLIVGLMVSVVATKQPNIVYIMADDFGFNDIGYHNPDIFTPNLDKLASSGVKLENYYVQPVCTPSRSQLMTGRYQIHTGLQHSVIFAPQKLCLPLDEVTLPQKLKEVGYKTHIVGKWHLGFYRKECLPTYRGFDSHYGYYCGNEDYNLKTVCGFFHGWKHSGKYCGFDFHDDEKPAWSANGTYSTFLYGQRAREVIINHNQSQPLFLYLPFQSVHFPLQAPDDYIKLYSHIQDPHRRVYSAMVTVMDDMVGLVAETLQEMGMMDETLIVFSTDNGGQTLYGGNNWPLRGRKESLWEGGIRGVGFVTGYGVQNPGRVSRGLFHVSDWFPTLLNIAGGNTNGTKPLDGVNVWNAIADPDSSSPRTEILHNIEPMFKRPYGLNPKLKPFPNKHGIDTVKGHTALRIGKWKLHTGDPGHDTWNPAPQLYLTQEVDLSCEMDSENLAECGLFPTIDDSSVRLYDIEADPEERSNMASYFPHIVDSMLERLAEYNATAVPVLWPPPDDNCDPSLRGGVWGPWVD
ncbi:arylsulfatase B-like [Styela clava]